MKVSDINDKNPEFSQLNYSLSVKEGLVGAHLGRVIATDADEGANAVVTYSLPSDVPFTIDQGTGDIFTNTALDYEQHKVTIIYNEIFYKIKWKLLFYTTNKLIY